MGSGLPGLRLDGPPGPFQRRLVFASLILHDAEHVQDIRVRRHHLQRRALQRFGLVQLSALMERGRRIQLRGDRGGRSRGHRV